MSYFPQLTTGATVQYPFELTQHFRTVMNLTEDGGVIRFSDLGRQIVEWRCQYDDLSAAEWDALKSLHTEVEGRLETFTFFDPSDNLLVWSEEFDRAAWIRDPFISVASGVADPFGGSAASLLSSGSVADQRITQVVRVPGTFSTCFSIWLRGSSPGGISMVRLSGGGLQLASAAPDTVDTIRDDGSFNRFWFGNRVRSASGRWSKRRSIWGTSGGSAGSIEL
jgi:hypothetical protein